MPVRFLGVFCMAATFTMKLLINSSPSNRLRTFKRKKLPAAKTAVAYEDQRAWDGGLSAHIFVPRTECLQLIKHWLFNKQRRTLLRKIMDLRFSCGCLLKIQPSGKPFSCIIILNHVYSAVCCIFLHKIFALVYRVHRGDLCTKRSIYYWKSVHRGGGQKRGLIMKLIKLSESFMKWLQEKLG